MYEITKLLSRDTFDDLIRILPKRRQKRYGRKRCQFEAILNGILQVLVNDVAWNKIASCGASYGTCYRYFCELQRRGKLKLIFEVLARGKTNVVESAIDSNSISSFRFRRMTGWCGKHKKISTKISLLTDIEGLPVDAKFDKGGADDRDFVPIHLQNGGHRRRIKELNLDKGYTSCDLRRKLRKRGTHVNMQIRKGDYIRKKGPKFGFKEDKYKVRFLIEKVFAWMENFRHIKVRREYKPAMFKAFVYLSLILILLRN
jgi:transposase